MRDLSLMTWKEVRTIDKEKSIVFLVMAPIEEHGVCLPIATDLLEGANWSEGAMKRLEKNLQVECYTLPPFPIAAASVNEFYGSIHFSMKDTYRIAYDLIESIQYMGFKNIVVIASHADPQHQIAIEKAVRKANKKNGLSAFAPMGQIFMGTGVKPSEDLETFEKKHANDFHAGWIETSSLLDMDESYVRAGYKSLPASDITDKDMIFRKKQIEAMGEYGHIGSPNLASKELGEQLNKNCIDSICDAVEKFYNRNGFEKYGEYSLYKILPLHIGFIEAFGKVRRRRVAK
ncbi:MAG: creatininase family protein [Eubacterium sp.]|nr:creatininase family protein [Eubacterium sp.]